MLRTFWAWFLAFFSKQKSLAPLGPHEIRHKGKIVTERGRYTDPNNQKYRAVATNLSFFTPDYGHVRDDMPEALQADGWEWGVLIAISPEFSKRYTIVLYEVEEPDDEAEV